MLAKIKLERIPKNPHECLLYELNLCCNTPYCVRNQKDKKFNFEACPYCTI